MQIGVKLRDVVDYLYSLFFALLIIFERENFTPQVINRHEKLNNLKPMHALQIQIGTKDLYSSRSLQSVKNRAPFIFPQSLLCPFILHDQTKTALDSCASCSRQVHSNSESDNRFFSVLPFYNLNNGSLQSG